MRSSIIFIWAMTLIIGCEAPGQPSDPLKLVNTIPLDHVEGRIDHFGLDAGGQRLFMAALGNNTIEVIDLAAGKVVRHIKGLSTPQGVAFAPDSNRLAVANDKDGSCRLYDGTSFEQVASIDLKDDADNIRYDASSRRFWVGYGDGGLAAIDAASGKQVADVKLDGHPESFQLETSGKRIFVNVPGAGHVAVIDRQKAEVVAKWPIKGASANFPMALDEANHRLFVGCRQPAKLLVLDTESGKTIASLDIVGDTDDLWYDATSKRIYVTGGEGRITVIGQSNVKTYTVIGQVKTAPGARTSYFISQTHTLYVAVPHRGNQKAELRAFRAE